MNPPVVKPVIMKPVAQPLVRQGSAATGVKAKEIANLRSSIGGAIKEIIAQPKP